MSAGPSGITGEPLQGERVITAVFIPDPPDFSLFKYIMAHLRLVAEAHQYDKIGFHFVQVFQHNTDKDP